MNTKSVILLFLLFIFSSSLYSQFTGTSSKWKSPFFTVEVAGSYDAPIQGSNGSIGDFFKFKNYGTSLGWGAQFNFKFGLGDKGIFRPYVTLGYAQLQGSNDKWAFIDSNEIAHGYPLKGTLLYDSTAGTSKIILRNPYIGIGFEFAYTELDKKKRSFIPFLGFEMVLNVITGIYTQTPIKVPPPNVSYSGLYVPFTIKSDVRVGIGVSLGADWRLTKAFGLVFGTKYKLANLIGKKSDFLQEENKMNLNDAGAQGLNQYLSTDRNIGYFEFYLGASFFIGKSKK